MEQSKVCGFAGIDLEASSGSDLAIVNIGRTGSVVGGVGIFSDVPLTLNNRGTIAGGFVGSLSLQAATHVTNSGILQGTVTLSSLNDDTFTDFTKVGKVIKSGTVVGVIHLGYGDDHFNGGANVETIQDGPGSDTVKFGGGKDFYIASGNLGSDGVDTVDGGSGHRYL